MVDGTSGELQFEPPGPGGWTLDPVHFPRPVTRYFAQTHPEPFAAGTADFSRFYGLLIDGTHTAYVNGFAYGQTRPAPEEEIPQRFARAEQVVAGKLWREQLEDWDQNRKPASIAAHRAIQAVDPDQLDDAELAAYIVRCRDHHRAMMFQHMRFTASAVVPTGDFLAHVQDWTGQPPGHLLTLLRGSAPVSAGGSDEHDRLVAAFRGDPAAVARLESSDDPAEVLASLRSWDGPVGVSVTDYLDLVGNRLLDGFDISEPAAHELPESLVRALRATAAGDGGGGPESDAELQDRIAGVRAQVPEADRGQFDELLGEARLMYRLRDERGIYSDIWASGLMRRAALAAGRRLAGRDLVHEPVHVVDADVDEMCSLLVSGSGPSADELAARAAYRATHDAKEAPAVLGPPPPHPPDMAGLPPAIGRLMRAAGLALGAVFGSSDQVNEEKLVRGLPASPGQYEGPARLIRGPAEFDRIRQGDVLVTGSTSEAFNILLPLLGAIVTDSGGLLSHAAIVAREYGVPGVVGTREATDLIADGTLVRVDGTAGEVTVLA